MPEVPKMWWHPHDGSGRMELVWFFGRTGDGTHASVQVLSGARVLPQPTSRVRFDELSPYEPMPEHDVESVEAWLDA